MGTRPQAPVYAASQRFAVLIAAIGGGLLGALLARIGGAGLVGVVWAAYYIKIRSRIRLGLCLGGLTDLAVLTVCALATVLGATYHIVLLGSWSIPNPLFETVLGAIAGTLLTVLIWLVMARKPRLSR
jgi:hypothetical protein